MSYSNVPYVTYFCIQRQGSWNQNLNHERSHSPILHFSIVKIQYEPRKSSIWKYRRRQCLADSRSIYIGGPIFDQGSGAGQQFCLRVWENNGKPHLLTFWTMDGSERKPLPGKPPCFSPRKILVVSVVVTIVMVWAVILYHIKVTCGALEKFE